MRLWHQDLIPYLTNNHLSGQHRECCSMRGAGWGRSHSVVNYVFDYSPRRLFDYHSLIMGEMERRHYNYSIAWLDPLFRGWGKRKVACKETLQIVVREFVRPYWKPEQLIDVEYEGNIYPEHNEQYLIDCLNNIKDKGLTLKKPNPFDL